MSAIASRGRTPQSPWRTPDVHGERVGRPAQRAPAATRTTSGSDEIDVAGQLEIDDQTSAGKECGTQGGRASRVRCATAASVRWWMFVAIIPTATVTGVLAAAAVEKLFFAVVRLLVFVHLFVAVGGSFERKFGFLSRHPWARRARRPRRRARADRRRATRVRVAPAAMGRGAAGRPGSSPTSEPTLDAWCFRRCSRGAARSPWSASCWPPTASP